MFLSALAKGRNNIITLLILRYQSSDLCICYLVYNFYKIANAVAIYGVTKFHFRLYFISIGYCYLAHVISKAAKLSSLPIVPTRCSANPYIQSLLYIRIFPMP